jgi:hypothetical protein
MMMVEMALAVAMMMREGVGGAGGGQQGQGGSGGYDGLHVCFS